MKIKEILGDPSNYFLGIPRGISVICSPPVFLIAAEAGGLQRIPAPRLGPPVLEIAAIRVLGCHGFLRISRNF